MTTVLDRPMTTTEEPTVPKTRGQEWEAIHTQFVPCGVDAAEGMSERASREACG